MNKKNIIIFIIVILIFVALFALGKSVDVENVVNSKISNIKLGAETKNKDQKDLKDAFENYDKAPNFNLKDYNGNDVKLSDFSGKYLVVNSWATWCPFCVNELPDFVEAIKSFGDDVIFIAINRAESLITSKKFSDELGVSDEMVLLLDPEDSFYKSIGGFSMPETLFVDKDGNIVIHKRGPMKTEDIIEKVQEIMK